MFYFLNHLEKLLLHQSEVLLDPVLTQDLEFELRLDLQTVKWGIITNFWLLYYYILWKQQISNYSFFNQFYTSNTSATNELIVPNSQNQNFCVLNRFGNQFYMKKFSLLKKYAHF